MTTQPIISYSKTTNGFYISTINYPSLPNDLVTVTQAQYDDLFAAQSAGQVIQADANGNPEAVTPTPPIPTVAQQAATALANGVVLTCTSVPTLNGTYSIGPNTEVFLLGTLAYVNLNQSFWGNSSTTPWYDASGTAHNFPVSQFVEFAEAMGTYIQAVTNWQLGGGNGSLPSNAITIA